MNSTILKAKLDYGIKVIDEYKEMSLKSEDYNELMTLFKETLEIFEICTSEPLEDFVDIELYVKHSLLSSKVIELSTYITNKCQNIILLGSANSIMETTNKIYEDSISLLEGLL